MQSKMNIHQGLKSTKVKDIHQLSDLYILPGDDAAAIKTDSGYLLHACEGMISKFVEQHPYFAGWSAVMANISDIAAMGGRACSVVNSFWHQSPMQAQALMQGMQAACATYAVPLVGGHTHIDATLQPNLSVAIQGHAVRLLSVMHVRPAQKILLVLDLDGEFHPGSTYWKCFEHKSPLVLQQQLHLLPYLAEQELAWAARDISNAGILGTLLMLLEASGMGADIQLDQLQKPEHVTWQHWLQLFPSFGFLITADEQHCEDIIQTFGRHSLHCQVIGKTDSSGQVKINFKKHTAEFWNFNQERFTGLSYTQHLQRIHEQYKSNGVKERHLCQV